MISKRAAVGIGVTVVLLAALVVCIYETPWDNMKDDNDDLNHIAFGNHDSANTDPILDDDDNLDENSLNFKVFEEYGPLIAVLAILMFGAMVGGICVAREDNDGEDDE